MCFINLYVDPEIVKKKKKQTEAQSNYTEFMLVNDGSHILQLWGFWNLDEGMQGEMFIAQTRKETKNTFECLWFYSISHLVYPIWKLLGKFVLCL